MGNQYKEIFIFLLFINPSVFIFYDIIFCFYYIYIFLISTSIFSSNSDISLDLLLLNIVINDLQRNIQLKPRSLLDKIEIFIRNFVSPNLYLLIIF